MEGRLKSHPSRSGTPIWLAAAFGVFLLVLGYLVAASLMRREMPTFEPTATPPTSPRHPFTNSPVVDTVTIDARDDGDWQFFDFARGTTVPPPDTAGWDLALRRFHVIAAGGVADLGRRPFETVALAPEGGYAPTLLGRDTVNAAIDRWYRYSYFTHLLEPNGHVYAVRTREGRFAKLEFLSYYCPGLSAGCPTFRYLYRPDGSRDFTGRP